MITRARPTYYVAMGVGALSLVLGFSLAGADLIWGAPAALLVAAAWLWGDRRGRSWIGSLGLTLYVLMAALGVLFTMTPAWAIVAVIAGLVAWDVGRFNRFLARVNHIKEPETIEKRYLRRLWIVASLGVGVAGLATWIRLDLGFGIAMLLGFISIVGFSRAISYLRQESD